MITVQSVLGALCFAVWGLLKLILSGDDLMPVMSAVLPYFVSFEPEIFSRYVPGVKAATKRLDP